MKHLKIFAATAASVLCATAAMSASAAEEIMTFRIAADKSAVTTDEIAEKDAVLKGEVFIDNYSALTSLRLILKSDDPVVIENGDFTRHPEKVDKQGVPLHRLFEEHADVDYMQYSELTKESNVVLWYSKGFVNDEPATVSDPTSSFVNFDIRIPKGTKPGDYKLYISTEVKTNEANQKEEDFFAYGGKDQLILDQNVKLAPLDIAVYLLGDTNLDGAVDIQDAQLTLKAYTEGVAGKKNTLTPAQSKAANVNANEEVSVDDAQLILMYYTNKYVAGKANTTWESLIQK